MSERHSLSNSFLNKSVLLCCCVTLLSASMIGCNRGQFKTYPTKGRVVFFDGSPVHVGSIELRSKSNQVQARGTIQKGGFFTLSTYREGDGAVEGLHDVVIVQFVMSEDVQGLHGGTLGVVNPKYGDYSTTTLTCKIERSEENDLLLQVDGVDAWEQQDANHEHADEDQAEPQD